MIINYDNKVIGILTYKERNQLYVPCRPSSITFDLDFRFFQEIDLQMIDAYQEGIKALEEQDGLTAAKKFSEAELLFPQSKWAPKSALMAAYSYYSQDYYGDAIAELQRFLRIYPFYENLDYAYYLLAVCYYEQIVDEKKDLQSIVNAKNTFIFVIRNYPNTEYALDAEFKIDLINDTLASKEMYIGRYYFDKKKMDSSN